SHEPSSARERLSRSRLWNALSPGFGVAKWTSRPSASWSVTPFSWTTTNCSKPWDQPLPRAPGARLTLADEYRRSKRTGIIPGSEASRPNTTTVPATTSTGSPTVSHFSGGGSERVPGSPFGTGASSPGGGSFSPGGGSPPGGRDGGASSGGATGFDAP